MGARETISLILDLSSLGNIQVKKFIWQLDLTVKFSGRTRSSYRFESQQLVVYLPLNITVKFMLAEMGFQIFLISISSCWYFVCAEARSFLENLEHRGK